MGPEHGLGVAAHAEGGVEVAGRAPGVAGRGHGGGEEFQNATEHDRYVTGLGRVVSHVHGSPPWYCHLARGLCGIAGPDLSAPGGGLARPGPHPLP
ncbi:hypothetical protein GCM10009527_017190 [Actinomadura nitritigenes]